MEKLEAKTNEFSGSAELRCKGWCHDRSQPKYEVNLPNAEYFN
ncbi:MAG: hypothetical protein AABX88_00425 [Nanoarchaeota archaeon]